MTSYLRRRVPVVAFFTVLGILILGRPGVTQTTNGISQQTFDHLHFRNIGPATMAGRIDDFAVLETNPSVFYVAAATGGLWKTVNNGTTWEPEFQHQDVISIGDVAIPADDASLVWVGSGENNNRQSSSWGGGVYKSTDGGHTWKNMGLADTRHIARIIIDPIDHDVVYVAALGHLWGPNHERGIFKTTDGGLTWKNVLFVDDNTGATELVMDPSNDKVLYAATYQRMRKAWGMNGGGPGSAIYKSTDAGRSWTQLTNGIPDGPKGRIGLDVYRKNPNILYARIQAEHDSGVYRSDDAGASWKMVSDVNPRPMYFSQIRIDPNDDHRIYVLGVQLYLSDDGGKTFVQNGTLHSDHHAFWIDPHNSNHLMTGNDGGIGISWDRGRKWDFVDNLVVGQFYHVSYDMETPYNVCGGMQDNYVWCGPSAVRSRYGIGNADWTSMHGGDGFVALIDPNDPRTIYSESQDGNVDRTDRDSNERKLIQPVAAAGEKPLRWNWNTPLAMSHFDSKTLFIAANKLFKSTDRGMSWKAISPDLTSQADRETFSIMGVVGKDIQISKNDGYSSFPTLVAFSESPKKAGIYYTGADDGTVYVSRDDGAHWTNISGKFPGAPKNAYVSRLTASAFDERTVYATLDNHREDDYKPYVFMSTDYGGTWRSIASNLPDGQAVKCITEDRKNPDVLYLGTEFGLFVSLDRGGRWIPLKANLPTVPIDEITIQPRDNDMLLATHGRGIWILDDITPIQHAAEAARTQASLFDIRPAVEFHPADTGRNFAGDRRFWGENPVFGASVTYYLRDAAKEVKLSIQDASGHVVREIAGEKLKDAMHEGINRVQWDLRHQPLPALRGRLAQGARGGGSGRGSLQGPFVLPGDYRVTLTVDGRSAGTKSVHVSGDPIMSITDADRKTWHDTAMALHDLQGAADRAAETVSDLSDRIRGLQSLSGARPTGRDGREPAAGQADGALQSVIREVSDKLAGLRRDLAVPTPGEPARFGGGDEERPVRTRIGQLKGQVMASTSLPTAMQLQQLDEDRRDLATVIANVNGVISNDLPRLYKVLGTSAPTMTPLKTLATASGGAGQE